MKRAHVSKNTRGKVRFASELLSRIRRYVDLTPLFRVERVSLEWAAERLSLHAIDAPRVVDLSADRFEERSACALLHTYDTAKVDRVLSRAAAETQQTLEENPRMRLVIGEPGQPTMALRFSAGEPKPSKRYCGALIAHRLSSLSDYRQSGQPRSPRDAFLSEVLGLLRPGGRVVILENSLSRQQREAVRVLHAVRFSETWSEPLEALESRLVRAGFVQVRSESLAMSASLRAVIAEAPNGKRKV